MTDEKLKEILVWFKKELNLNDDNLDSELEKWITFERDALLNEISRIFKVNADDFEVKLREYLTLKA